jgi:hypothetical protein
MIDAGAVHLRLTLSDTPRRIETAAAACRRPMAARVLGSKRRDEVLTLVPRLFAVCGQAQGLAAKLALTAARGEAAAVHRDLTVAQEGAREHLWHFFSQEKPLLAAGLAALKASPEALQTFLDGHLGLPAADWLAFTQAAELDAWAKAGDGLLHRSFRQTLREPQVATVPLLPIMDAAASLKHWPLLDVVFAARPHWHDSAAETGALARQQSQGLLQSLVQRPWAQRRAARLRELLSYGSNTTTLPGDASAQPVAPRRGRALVETARGLLMHEVELESDLETVAEYVLVAPTEWNFHPRGPLAAWLHQWELALDETVEEVVAAAVAALDPCVTWSLTTLP